ncbi:ADP/ATP carrier protein [Raphanus sativus]|nr:ADP/ATP carrier protein [Raphanus sativus]
MNNDYVQFKTLSWTLRVKFPLMQLKSLHFFIVTLLQRKAFRLWFSEGRSNGRKKNTPKTGTMESLKCLVSSPYIRDLASLVVAYAKSLEGLFNALRSEEELEKEMERGQDPSCLKMKVP